MTISCEKAEKMIVQEQDTEELRQHLSGCHSCKEFQKDYGKIKKLCFVSSENLFDVPVSNDFAVMK